MNKENNFFKLKSKARKFYIGIKVISFTAKVLKKE